MNGTERQLAECLMPVAVFKVQFPRLSSGPHGNAVKHYSQCISRFQNRRVGPAADKPRRPTIRRASIGGPALAFARWSHPTLTGFTLARINASQR